jgi:hypothetical protein
MARRAIRPRQVLPRGRFTQDTMVEGEQGGTVGRAFGEIRLKVEEEARPDHDGQLLNVWRVW